MKHPDPMQGRQEGQQWGAGLIENQRARVVYPTEAEGDAISSLEMPARGQRRSSPRKTMLAQG